MNRMLRKTSHAAYITKYHIVWIPKYRRMVLSKRIQKRLRQILKGIAERYDFPIDTLDVAPDHVHLFVTIPPTISVAEAVNIFKGVSSKILRREFLEEIEEMLWGGELWGRGYFVSTVNDKTTSEMIRRYIRYQKYKADQLRLF